MRTTHNVPLEVHEVFEQAQNISMADEQVVFLRKHSTIGMQDYLRGTFDPMVNWDIAEDFQYEPSSTHSHPTSLRRTRNLLYASPTLQPKKMDYSMRERIFRGIMEGVHPKDAEMLLHMVNKEFPYNISKEVLVAAFPSVVKD